ncbi:MAG TPA: hybrid sensor histidine kinase/response regulator [Cyanobacteria bacterium UBA11162]|nr:hybrid sensor histidine kinase/response regulator [Cyanobacteria bacterium UBA11162]
MYCEWYKSALRDDDGNLVSILSLVLDVTERHRAEQALRESEQRFRIAQELSLDAFTILNSVRNTTGEIIDFEWRYVNPKAGEILNHSPDYLLGKKLLDVLPGNKTNSELFERYVEVVDSGNPHDIEIPYNAEGISGWFRNMAVKIGDGIAISFSDISQRKRNEVERMQLLERERIAREEAEAANRIKDEFLTVLSHELRSPLNPILGWAKLLRERKFDQKATDRALETIERNAKLQSQLIEDLLDVSRILRGKLVLNITPVNLMTTIEAALETVRLAAQAKAIQIQTLLDPTVGLIRGDANRLQQVIWNLLSNAVKFTPSGGQIEVHLSTYFENKSSRQNQPFSNNPNPKSMSVAAHSRSIAEGVSAIANLKLDYAEIQVKDNGKGISPEFLPHVFEYFRQENGSTTRQFGGLGLGLAIVRHLVELHGGLVFVESEGENLGATFTVRLPLMVANSPTHQREVQVLELPNLTGLDILIVDDETDIRELIAFILEQSGASVSVTTSAEEALIKLKESIPDVLLSDIGMPHVDGYMLMEKVKDLLSEKGRKIPAIALTAYAGEYHQQKALEAGFQMHLAKPVEPEELVRAIARLVGRV